MRTLKHPVFDDMFVQVEDSEAADWRDAGWRTSSKKAAEEAGVELQAADETPLEATEVHAEGVTPSTNPSTGAS